MNTKTGSETAFKCKFFVAGSANTEIPDSGRGRTRPKPVPSNVLYLPFC